MVSRICLALLCFAAVAWGQRTINTGEGKYNLFFAPGGAIRSDDISPILPLSFTFEAWVMSPFPMDGAFKTICARWARGPDGTNHNRWADWNFQVQAWGTLNFFMGNSLPDVYGVLISSIDFPQAQWTHVAFTVDTPPGSLNPRAVTIYVNGEAVAVGGWNGPGQRRVLSEEPIYIGGYINQDDESFPDPDPNKWWRGYIDETRIWGGVRTSEELKFLMQRVANAVLPELAAPHLLAYYRMNLISGTFVPSETGNNHAVYSHPDSGSPIRKFSGAKIHVDIDIGKEEEVIIELPGVPTQDFLEFQYIITSLPHLGELWASGLRITRAPYALASNKVLYKNFATDRDSTHFSYIGDRPGETEKEDAIVFLKMDAVGSSREIIDECGVAGGDNSTCQCMPLPFHGYSLNDIERILLLWEIEQTIEVIHETEVKIENLQKMVPMAIATDLQVVITASQNFLSGCMLNFGKQLHSFQEQLQDIDPIPFFVD